MAIERVVNLTVNDNINETTKNVTSLKTELRKAQQEVAHLSDKFGATSKEAVAAAKRASELKDKIGDAKNLTDAFNPDAKFKALSSSLAGVASGFAAYQGALGLAGKENKDLEKQLLKVQSAMALAQGLQGLGEARDSFKQLKAVAIDSFNGIKSAIGSTGIGLLVIALGALYANWDKIKESVSGVSQRQKDLNVLSAKNLEQENKKLEAINDQDNILKLQGKTEKQILQFKIAQTDEAINAANINLDNIKTTNKEQEKAAQQNYKYLKSFIDFISIPQRFLYENGAKAINGLINLINKIPGVKIDAKLDENFAANSADYITKLVFDPEEVAKKGQETVNEQEKTLKKLKNDRAGYQLAINDIDKKASDDAKKKADEDAKALAESLKRSKEDTDAIRKEIQDAIGAAQDKNTEGQISAQEAEIRLASEKYFRLIELAKQNGFDTADLETQKANEINDINLKYQQIKYDADKAQADKDKLLAEEVAKHKEETLRENYNNLQNVLYIAGGKFAKIAKALAIADIVRTAYTSISTAISNEAKVPAFIGVVPNPVKVPSVISTALSIGSTIANSVKSIQAINNDARSVGGGSSSGGGASGGGGGATAPSFNIVGQNPNNQLAQSIAQQQKQPIQAFVVSGNVTNAQSLDRNRIDTATFN